MAAISLNLTNLFCIKFILQKFGIQHLFVDKTLRFSSHTSPITILRRLIAGTQVRPIPAISG
jgi:hypothetical protein